MTDHAPRSSAKARWFLIRHLSSDKLAALMQDRAEVTTRVLMDECAQTEFRVSPSLRDLITDEDDADVCRILRTLPGADPSVSMGSPGRTYTVTWDGVRTPV